MKRIKRIKRPRPSFTLMIIFALAGALVTGAFAFSAMGGAEHSVFNLLYRADMALSDTLYQRESRISGQVAVIGIDVESLEAIGSFPWPRSIMAAIIEMLNDDPENRPAVIGIDILFTGESDPEEDARLAEAAAEYGNVVVAMAGVYGDRMVTGDGGEFHMESGVVVSYDEPYPKLRAAADRGHINVMLDKDGILRHSVDYIHLPQGERVPSFAYAIHEKYAALKGLEISRPTGEARVFSHQYIPFQALPGAFEIGSVRDLLAGETLDLGGKIVLIGPYAAGLQDAMITSIDRGAAMYGVEVNANIIESLLGGNTKKELPDSFQIILVMVISTSFLIWSWDRKILFVTAAWLILASVGVGASLALYDAGYVIHVFWLPAAVTALYIAAVGINYTRASMEKRRVTNTFKRYVAPEIVKEILEQGVGALELGGRLCDVAVLFADIRDFTPLSEALEAPAVVEILNRWLSLVSSCVMKNGGALDKFMGDAAMAFWGAPLPREDGVFEAVETALDIIEGAKPLENEVMEKYGKSLGFGIGIHFGPAVVGNIGSMTRMDYTAIGDTVNTAARLEANAPAGTILVSRAVADALRGRVNFVSLGDSVKLKGKAEGFEVLTVESLVGATAQSSPYPWPTRGQRSRR